ncbi:MAG: tetratricopeptide repeat protein [Gallionella sp.]|jgi:tetratricopeptide (TPR) repeat protein|nr:tetratricopeptide repeat protein [Gallionella sp.]MCK9355250.1 tetratricopeptide repeat protein [Gallionella sp.]
MSLLLEARKKALSAEASQATATDKLQLENQPASAADEARQSAREAGQNLFSAKSPAADHSHINPYLLSALGGTMLLLAAGAGYWWYLDSARGLSPQHPVAATTQPIQVAAVTEEPQSAELPADNPVAEEIAPEPALPDVMTEPAPAVEPPRQKSPVRIEPQRTEAIDPLLRDAYLAYRSGKPDEAQPLYQEMVRKDANNADALLGLAAIAQQRGESLVAMQYYSRVLTLDPRNAVANAGMSALNTEDDGNESRLKTLLREQNNSAALHFALGNLYAGQSRWSEAQQAYFNAWTLESDNAEFAYNLAVSLDHLGQGNLAARYYQRAQQLDATHSAGFDHAQVARRIEALGRPGR